jgi:hypothetical protein
MSGPPTDLDTCAWCSARASTSLSLPTFEVPACTAHAAAIASRSPGDQLDFVIAGAGPTYGYVSIRQPHRARQRGAKLEAAELGKAIDELRHDVTQHEKMLRAQVEDFNEVADRVRLANDWPD